MGKQRQYKGQNIFKTVKNSNYLYRALEWKWLSIIWILIIISSYIYSEGRIVDPIAERRAQETRNRIQDDWSRRMYNYKTTMELLNQNANHTTNQLNAIANSHPEKINYALISGYGRSINTEVFKAYENLITAPYLSNKDSRDMFNSSLETYKSYNDNYSKLLGSVKNIQDEVRKAEEKAKKQLLTKIGVGVVLAVVTIATGGLAAPAAGAAWGTMGTIGAAGTVASMANTVVDIRNYAVLQNKGYSGFSDIAQTQNFQKGLSVVSAASSAAQLYEQAGKFSMQAAEQGTKITGLSKEFSISNAVKIADAQSLQTVYTVKQVTSYTQMGIKAASIPQILNPKVYGRDYGRVTAGLSGVIGITDLTYTGPAALKQYYNQDASIMKHVQMEPPKFAYTSFNPVNAVSTIGDIKFAATGKALFKDQDTANAIMQVAGSGYSLAQKSTLNFRFNQASERAEARTIALNPGLVSSVPYKDVTNIPDPRTRMFQKIGIYTETEKQKFMPVPIYIKFVNYKTGQELACLSEKEYSTITFQLNQNKTSISSLVKTGWQFNFRDYGKQKLNYQIHMGN